MGRICNKRTFSPKNNSPKKGAKNMLQVTYKSTKSDHTLSGILSIEANNEMDLITLGNPDTGTLVGMIYEQHDGFVFTPEAEDLREYDAVSSYGEAMLNVFIEIANNTLLSHEFAVLVNRKAMANKELF
jgi:hypothetical protein